MNHDILFVNYSCCGWLQQQQLLQVVSAKAQFLNDLWKHSNHMYGSRHFIKRTCFISVLVHVSRNKLYALLDNDCLLAMEFYTK